MQDPVMLGNDQSQKDSNLQLELSANWRKRIDQMRPPLFVSRERQATAKALKVFKKRREGVRKIVYDRENTFAVSDEEIKSRMRGIRDLTSLTSITLRFSNCKLITNAGILGVSGCLGNLNSLTNIILSFYGCESITDEGLISVCNSLRRLSSLRNIAIDLSWCQSITDAGMRSINCIRNLPSLTAVTLHFSGCRQITDAGIKSISNGLRHLTSLTRVTLYFGCTKVTDEGINSVVQGLKTALKCIKTIHIRS